MSDDLGPITVEQALGVLQSKAARPISRAEAEAFADWWNAAHPEVGPNGDYVSGCLR
jgi:hypothetical protein